ncbi:MAG TPA: DUF1565 domain-containing protein [Lacunisphaera sp.]
MKPRLLALLLCPTLLLADPSEDIPAWRDPPTGYQWAELGPRTVAVPLAEYTAVHHVSAAGSDETGDGSRAHPWKTIRHALAQPVAKGRTAVLVAMGRYQEGVLAMKPTVDLYGGFDATSWERNIGRFATTLSGGGQGRVLLGADNSRLDGFVIEDGVVRDHGGALLCDAVAPVISNNVFRHNRTLARENHPGKDTDRRRVRGNDGGAIALLHAADADIRHNLFIRNETDIGYGGALSAAHDCLPIIGHNVFWGNRAGVKDPDTRAGNGGAVALLFSSRAAVLHNLFAANSTLGFGDGGALFMEYYCWPEIGHNAFIGNQAADDGGGMDHQKFSYPKVRANLFYGNRAGKSGGGLHMDDSTCELQNNIFAYNRVRRNGGGFAGTHSWVRALNNTVTYNEAPQGGGGIQIVNVKNPFLRASIFRNNLITFNAPDAVRFDSDGQADVAYNIMHPGGYTGGYYNFDHAPEYADDGRQLRVGAAQHDAARFVTTFPTDAALGDTDLTGRIVRSGDHWSMVQSNTASTVTLWGPAPAAAATEIEILPTFHLSGKSRAITRGTYPEFPPLDIDGDQRQYPAVSAGADEYRPAPRDKKKD